MRDQRAGAQAAPAYAVVGLEGNAESDSVEEPVEHD